MFMNIATHPYHLTEFKLCRVRNSARSVESYCTFVTVILKVLNWGVYTGHEIFVMMTPGFLSNLNSCIPCKAWLHGWWITIDH